ncbi:MAG: YjbH domain-containing protein [Pseudomonadota bacterium]
MLGRLFALVCATAFGIATTASAQTLAEREGIDARPHLSFNGTPGMVDMPSAYAMPDGDLTLSVGHFGGITRASLAFQVSPRLTGVFRWSSIDTLFDPERDYYDRSFDLIYRLADETRFRPAISVGLRDFGGTEFFASEYIVASKQVHRRVNVSLGLGWGRLASQNGFTNPLGILDSSFETRPITAFSGTQTGEFRLDSLFHGDAAVFGGVIWDATDRLTFVAEYSSDAYEAETRRGVFERKSSVNFGASYDVNDVVTLSAYSLYGTEIGAVATFKLNPKVPPTANGVERAPQPVRPRPDPQRAPQAWSTAWAAQPAAQPALEQTLTAALATEGLVLETVEFTATKVSVSLRNPRFGRAAQAVGRAARIMTAVVPASVETFEITLVQQGMATTRFSLARSDLEELEFAPDNAWRSYARTEITDAGTQPNARQSLAAPKLTFGLTPYLDNSLFDPNEPILFDIGVRARARWEPRPGWVLDASLRQPIYGNRDNTNRPSNSVLPFVRSEQDDFTRGNDPKLERLTFAHYFRPGTNLYGRVTAGYLELAYAGLSGEVLWKPPSSRLAMGVELNAVHQRAPGSLFGLGEGVFDNDALTGHVSAYYAFDGGYRAQLDVGRYLAEDWGSTVTFSRRFNNGWEVGAFATFTDVSSEEFGEGSFDKGVFVTIPPSWFVGQPSVSDATSVIRPVLRDGGARVSVSDRLYEMIQDDTNPALQDSWGRFWR